jgi:hypothetical protein
MDRLLLLEDEHVAVRLHDRRFYGYVEGTAATSIYRRGTHPDR